MCGAGCIADPVVVAAAGGGKRSGALACRVCAQRCGDTDAESLAGAVLCGVEDALAAAATDLRRELEGMLGALGGGGGGEMCGEELRAWAAEAVQTLRCVDGGIAALRENRCVNWGAAERAVGAVVARIQHLQDMLA